MSLLSAVTSGKQIGAQIHVVAGDNGVGKTTFAADFPSPIILDLENGSLHLNVTRIKKDKFPTIKEVVATLSDLKTTEHTYKTVVIDSAEALEGLIFDAVCAEGKVVSIEEYGGGYGKGYARSREMMREIMNELHALKEKGITSIIVAHTQIKPKVDVILNQTYDRIVMRANDKMAAIIRDLSDNIFYCAYKIVTTKDNGKVKAYGDGSRVMYTQPHAGYDAKNRLQLPRELPLSYDAFAEACAAKPEANVAQITEDIKAMSEKLDDGIKADIAAMLERYKNDPAKLAQVKNRVMKLAAA